MYYVIWFAGDTEIHTSFTCRKRAAAFARVKAGADVLTQAEYDACMNHIIGEVC